MSDDFVSIHDARIAKKGSIRGKIIFVGDLKSGTNDKGGDWTRKEFTIQDVTGSVKITAWGEDASKFKLNYKYEIVNPQWSIYKDEPQISPSKFGSFQCVGSAQTQATIPDEGSQTAPAPVNTTAPPPTDKEPTALPKLDVSIRGTIHCKVIDLLQIEDEVRETFKDVCPKEATNGNKIGMYTKIIFDWMNSRPVVKKE